MSRTPNPSQPKADSPLPPRWPSYTGTSQFVGQSPSGKVTVYVDPSLGDPALENAQDLVNDADRVVAANDAIFGVTGNPVQVILFALNDGTDGSGGADHMGCDYIRGAAIEVCVAYGNPARVSGLFEAELSECSMNGNLCGLSTGEGLSRWCAASVSNNALADFATGPAWYQNGLPNFVDTTDPTDQNGISTGNVMVFLSWLMSLGYGLNQIAPAMVALGDAGTLAQLYSSLTGNDPSTAWPTFLAAVQALPNGVTSDDPFGSPGVQALHASDVSWPIPTAVKVFNAILEAVAVRKSGHQIVAEVNAILAGSPRKPTAKGGHGGARSHRLAHPGRK